MHCNLQPTSGCMGPLWQSSHWTSVHLIRLIHDTGILLPVHCRWTPTYVLAIYNVHKAIISGNSVTNRFPLQPSLHPPLHFVFIPSLNLFLWPHPNRVITHFTHRHHMACILWVKSTFSCQTCQLTNTLQKPAKLQKSSIYYFILLKASYPSNKHISFFFLKTPPSLARYNATMTSLIEYEKNMMMSMMK